MTNPWFKFYGGEYLADPKMDALDANERSIWLTILCLSSQSEDGFIRYTTTEKLIEKAGVRLFDRPSYLNVMQKFDNLQMIERCNGDVTDSFKPKNWEKRQYSEGYSRVRKFREKNSNADETPLITIEERRIEEKRIEKNNTGANKFAKPTIEEVKNYCTERKNKIDPSKFLNYYESNGWKVGRNPMKNWKAAIRTWEQTQLSTQVRETKVYGKN
jgi:hypothetical protein